MGRFTDWTVPAFQQDPNSSPGGQPLGPVPIPATNVLIAEDMRERSHE